MSEPNVHWRGVCIDARDAEPVARFYAALLDWDITATDGDAWFQLRDPFGGVGINVQGDPTFEPPTWPEVTGAQQKQLHFEVEVGDLEAALRLAIASGGSEAPHQPPDRDPSRLRIVLDPAGHPLCLFVAGE